MRIIGLFLRLLSVNMPREGRREGERERKEREEKEKRERELVLTIGTGLHCSTSMMGVLPVHSCTDHLQQLLIFHPSPQTVPQRDLRLTKQAHLEYSYNRELELHNG